MVLRFSDRFSSISSKFVIVVFCNIIADIVYNRKSRGIVMPFICTIRPTIPIQKSLLRNPSACRLCLSPHHEQHVPIRFNLTHKIDLPILFRQKSMILSILINDPQSFCQLPPSSCRIMPYRCLCALPSRPILPSPSKKWLLSQCRGWCPVCVGSSPKAL